MTRFILLSALILTFACVTWAEAGTKLVWNRNVDDTANYNIYACVVKGCVATKTVTLLKATVPQPAVGVVPQWVYPVNTEGQSCVTAVDAAVNESACSVAVNFDGLAPAVPMNVLEQ